MKWINTHQLVAILKRFPNEQVETSAYLGCGIISPYLWKYNKKCFLLTIGAKSKSFFEDELVRLYSNQYWKVKPFFYLKDDQERQLAIQLVEELEILGHLEDIIIECEIDKVRICEHCHRLMNEGWLVDDIRTFCSDKCLRNAYPDIVISDLQAHLLEHNCMAYWTKWEE